MFSVLLFENKTEDFYILVLIILLNKFLFYSYALFLSFKCSMELSKLTTS